MSLLLDTSTSTTASPSITSLSGLEPIASSSLGIKNPSATESGITAQSVYTTSGSGDEDVSASPSRSRKSSSQSSQAVSEESSASGPKISLMCAALIMMCLCSAISI